MRRLSAIGCRRSAKTNAELKNSRHDTRDGRPNGPESATCKDLATTVGIVALLSASMLLAGCEYAIRLPISRNVKKIEHALNRETASAIVQKYLAADNEHGGLIAYQLESVGSEWYWWARGAPTPPTVTDGIVRFEAGPGSDLKKFKQLEHITNPAVEEATPSWFANSKFEIDLTRVRGVVFWDPVDTTPGRPRGRRVNLNWSEPKDTGGRRPPGSQSGTLTLLVQDGNNDEFVAALKYFAPRADFIAAR